jgi:hypothetical protein
VCTDLSAPVIEQASELAVNAARFRRHVRASGLSPKTQQTYLEAVDLVKVSDLARELDKAAWMLRVQGE